MQRRVFQCRAVTCDQAANVAWNRLAGIGSISIGLLCALCVSVVNSPLDDRHRPGLNHRDTEHAEKGFSMPISNMRSSGESGLEQIGQNRLDFNRSSLCTLRLCGESPVDDCHRSGLNHRDTEHAEKGLSLLSRAVR